MPILDCSVKTCYHNSNNRCCLKNIQVGGDEATTSASTACESFREESGAMNSCSCEHTPETTLNVDCEATNCTYNKDCTCNANHIDISGSNACHCDETECSSFSCK